ncbi:amylo-alpha-1,6-glucosidase [Spongiactinospora gelatinilytica]|uniref:Amylo-alpha-1,6-glucosidase n=1 Tax=Spongiactinospora gelatinilytica TaxID=2666298 RepID=A0A2W2H5T8_9ACTN|nr:glycogen debranching N-terminal domain-containing protein [Spongiactinospora gelatinilytica]PZG44828.1 amylo-alpha-1,6-glucosidase [Spongiactinospora gelatinilytica]
MSAAYPGRRVPPRLDDLAAVILAPTSALSGRDGQIRPIGAQGVFHADHRVLSRAVLLVDGLEPEAVAYAPGGPGVGRFVALARWLGDEGPDPEVRIERVRTVTGQGVREEITIISSAAEPLAIDVRLELGCDFAPMQQVRSGFAGEPAPAVRQADDTLIWRGPGGVTTTVAGEPVNAGAESSGASRPGTGGVMAVAAGEGGADPRLAWRVALAPGGRAVLRWSVGVTDPGAVVIAATGPAEWPEPEVRADDRRLARLLHRSLDDLRALRLADAAAPGDTFIGAGVPWYLTLFGRDSLWTARMLLPLGTGLAESTLRVLARRQSRTTDGHSGEAPGKIMHELRRGEYTISGRGGEIRLPPVYYGTVDATPLWVCLLHDAWRWGMPEQEVAPLLPALRAALGWLAGEGDPDGDGFVEYADEGGQGLANQGWKDSPDAVRFHDGRHAAAPIALAEVQGYAYEAATGGAALLDAFAGPGEGDRWREYAAALATRFRARFWVDTGPYGPRPALALDRDKRPVDSLTSNIGHLLGTGLLSPEEERQVAGLLAAPEMSGAFGLRTMSARDAGYNPLSYHCGSVWTHDTAIVIGGLAAAGYHEPAADLARSLLDAAEAFGHRLPELYGGDDRRPLGTPVPYPAACRPQAWTAAAAVTLVNAVLGVRPDVPAGRVALRPLAGAPLGALSVRGLRIADAEVEATVDASGNGFLTGLPGGLTLT